MKHGLDILPVSPTRLRAVFHLHIDDEMTERAIRILKKFCTPIRPQIRNLPDNRDEFES